MCDCDPSCPCGGQQNYRLQPCNGLQYWDACGTCMPQSKLKPTQPQNRNSKTVQRVNRKSGNSTAKTAKKASKKNNQPPPPKPKSKSSDASYGNSGSESTINETNGDSGSDTTIQAMDHTMRAYFMHTMEKLECLSAQLLRNECITSKMHLDIVQKICMFNQRNLTQFQSLVERLNYLTRDQNSSNDIANSEEDEQDCECDCDCGYYNPCNVRRSNEQPPPQMNKRSSSQASISRKKQTSSDEDLDTEYYTECEQKVKCLQKSLECTKKELDESLKRLDDYKRMRELDSKLSRLSMQAPTVSTNSKQRVKDESDTEAESSPKCCCTNKRSANRSR